MTVKATVREIMDRYKWDEFCEERGINPWAVNEGLMTSEEEFELSEDEAKKYGFIKDRDEDTYRW